MLRLIAVFAVFALVTLSLMPIQWVAVALKRPLRRRIPVVYHRSSAVCSASACASLARRSTRVRC